MRILITGATGFVGQHLLEELKSSEEKFAVRILSRKIKPILRCPEGIEFCKGDLSDVGTLINAFDGVDVVVNLAAELKNPENYEKTNVTGTKNLITLSLRHRVKKVIHLSSVGVVGAHYTLSPLLVTETTECNPSNQYERTKLESEYLLRQAAEENPIELVILRPTNVFGEFHAGNCLLHLMRHIERGRPIIHRAGALVNYVYVKDVCAAIVWFITHAASDRIYTVGQNHTMDSFVRQIADLLHVRELAVQIPTSLFAMFSAAGCFRVPPLARKLRALSNTIAYDDSKFRTMIGYRYGIEEGLRRTIAYYRLSGYLPSGVR